MPSESLNPDVNQSKAHRNRIIWGAIVTLLLLVIIIETVIIIEQKRVNQRIEAQAQQALGRFLKEGVPSVSQQIGADILFRNVRFCWSSKICINTNHLSATAQPLNGRQPLIFDDLKSYIVNVRNADVLITPKTLEGMFNESVFNYPGSKLRNLTVSINQGGSSNHVMLAGWQFEFHPLDSFSDGHPPGRGPENQHPADFRERPESVRVYSGHLAHPAQALQAG